MRVDKKAILAELERLYPSAGPELHFTNPYETLVATMLSAQCTDKRVNLVTPSVFHDFPTAAAMAQTTEEILYPYVKSCGFKAKAHNIVAACKLICEKHGGEVPHTMEELTALPGVGRKTANVVLNTVFRQPAMAVDTHIFRLANRTGLAPGKDVLEVEKALLRRVPKDYLLDAHHWLILHGRYVCTARKPKCGACIVRDLCLCRDKTD